MAYGDYSGPDKPNKGHEGGACNRQRCQAEPALYYNHGSYSWYCADCARDIGQDPMNLRGWEQDWRPRLGHGQFETREEITAREATKPVDVGTAIDRAVAPYFGPPKRREKAASSRLQRLLNIKR